MRSCAPLRAHGHHPVAWTSYAALCISAPLMMYFSSVVIIPTLSIISFCVLLVVMRRDEPTLTDVMVSILPMLTLVLRLGMYPFGILDTPLRRICRRCCLRWCSPSRWAVIRSPCL